MRRELLEWRSSRSLSLNEISWTNDEKDIMDGVRTPDKVEKVSMADWFEMPLNGSSPSIVTGSQLWLSMLD